MRRNFVLVVLLVLTFGAVTIVALEAVVSEQERILEQARQEEERNKHTVPMSVFARRDNFDARKSMEGLPDDYVWQSSLWKEDEKQRYFKLLKRHNYDMLVVPMAVAPYPLSRSIRSYMSAELSYAISSSNLYRIPDPYLVMKALGDGEKFYDLDDIVKMANSLGVKKVLLSRVGRMKANKMQLSSKMITIVGGEATAAPDFYVEKEFYDRMTLSDERTALDVFNEKLPMLLGELGIKFEPNVVINSLSYDDQRDLLKDPVGTIEAKSGNHLLNAYYYQYMAYLMPEWEERARERFIEKSLMEINKVDLASPHARAIKARAYMHFGLRLAALSVLDSPVNDEERAIVASLNGNLNQLEDLMQYIKSPVGRVLAMYDANRMAAEYDIFTVDDSKRVAGSLNITNSVWEYVNRRSLTEWDPWEQFSNLHVKKILDELYPLRSYTAKGIVEGGAALGGSSAVRDELDLSVVEHIGGLLSENPELWCVNRCDNSPKKTDVLELLDSISTDNLMRRAEYLTNIQGLPDKGLDFLSKISHVYEGHPRFALQRAYARTSLSKVAYDTKRDKLAKSAYEDAINALLWSNGQERVSSAVYSLRNLLKRNDYDIPQNLYTTEYPYKPFYPTWRGNGLIYGELSGPYSGDDFKIYQAEASYENATYHVAAVSNLAKTLKDKIIHHQLNGGDATKEKEKLSWLLSDASVRFDGRSDYLGIISVTGYESLQDLKKLEESHRAAVNDLSENVGHYMWLGLRQFELGDIDDSFVTLKSWPGFLVESSENKVKVANAAFEAGSLFYWSGDLEYAGYFYKLASELNTGSYGSLTARSRYHQINKEYSEVVANNQNRVSRYKSMNAYRDHIGLLHATGDSKRAWAVFNSIVSRTKTSKLWHAAVTGQRIFALNSEDVYQWASQYENLVTEDGYGFSAIHLFRESIVDRVPNKDLVRRIGELDTPVWQHGDDGGDVVRLTRDKDKYHYVGPHNMAVVGFRSLGDYKTSDMKKIKSDLVYFSEAYMALRSGEYKKSAKIFDEVRRYYDEANANVRYMLPYHAYVAHKSGNVSALKKFIDSVPDKYQRFDFHLVQAVLAGLDGDYEKSEQHLKLARVKSPYRESHQGERPIYVEYQYAEICELLFLTTNRNEYKEILLDWSRNTQKFVPWYSWSYSFVAKYSSEPSERRRSIALAYFLDKKSDRLRQIPDDEVKAAVNEYKDKIGSNGIILDGFLDELYI